jgi:hypothetical protein
MSAPQGIRLLAQHYLGHLVQALIAWRQNVNEDIKKNFSSNNVVNVQGVCKRVRQLAQAAAAAIDSWTSRGQQYSSSTAAVCRDSIRHRADQAAATRCI